MTDRQVFGHFFKEKNLHRLQMTAPFLFINKEKLPNKLDQNRKCGTQTGKKNLNPVSKISQQKGPGPHNHRPAVKTEKRDQFNARDKGVVFRV